MRAMAATIAAAMNKYLWAPSNDHYVVRVASVLPLHPCPPQAVLTGLLHACHACQSYAILPIPPATNLTQRDFVDYDSNLLAIMAGVPTSRDQSQRILAKLDDFACAHRRATWVSQVLCARCVTAYSCTGEGMAGVTRAMVFFARSPTIHQTAGATIPATLW